MSIRESFGQIVVTVAKGSLVYSKIANKIILTLSIALLFSLPLAIWKLIDLLLLLK